MKVHFTKQLGFIGILFLLSLIGCKNNGDNSSATEGYIEYSITYPGIDKGDVFAAMMMPTKMELYFKGSKTQTQLGKGSIFKTTIVTDQASHDGFQLLKVLNKKYILKLDSNGVKENADKVFGKVTYELVNETKEIAGYECKKAKISTENGKSFDIFYTEALGNPNNPNWFNPYKGINGMLMEYSYKDYNIDMRFSATKVELKSVEDVIFEEPKGFEPITKEKMSEIFESF